MASKAPVTKDINTLGEEKRTHSQQGGLGTLWSNQDEMKRYVSKLKSELDEQKSRVKRVHRDKAEEMKRLQENLDNERQKAVENVSKKLESDKVYELKKLRESVLKQKESELRQVLRLKDEEMRALKQELQDSRNTTRILELENKRNLNERQRGDTEEQDRRLRNEVAALRNDKRRLEESLRIKTDADFEKAEMIRRMKHEHDTELHRLTRESKRESLKEFRHLRAVSREIEAKNSQLAAKETEMRRLEQEKNSLGDELNLQRKKIPSDGNLSKSNSFNLQQRPKDLSASSDFENATEDRIKKLKMRNTELVAIARKLEGKAKRLQEEKDISEKSSELNPEVGNLRKAFAHQRAKDLAEHAKLLMNKDHEIDNLKKELAQLNNCSSSVTENGNVDDLEKIVQQTAKEHLLLEKQLSSKGEVLAEENKEISAKNLKLSNDNEILQAELRKLQDVETKHFKTVFEMNQIREEHMKLQHASSEKDKRIYKLELEKQTCVAKNNALQKKNSELSHKVEKLGKLENECSTLKEKLETLKNEYDMLRAENSKLRAQVESLSTLKKEVERLQEDNLGLQKEKEASVFELEEREREISSLHKAQSEAQKKYDEQVNERDEMIRRLKEQPAQTLEKTNVEFHNPSLIGTPVLSSTPKTTTFTQTSRPSSPILSPINDYRSEDLQKAEELNNPSEADSQVLDSLHVPDYYATSSSASFDLEKAGTRIEQLAASDSDETDFESSRRATIDSPSASSDISDYSEEDSDRSSSENASYSADVSHTSDVEEPQRTTKEDSKKEVKNDEDEEDVFIGNQMHESPDVEEKLSIFIAKYSYDPMLYSPNENPESELAFQAGDYLYVYGDTDEDGFFVGELMNGERGLVPSNFVERIADEDEAILKESHDKDDGDSEDDSSDEEITLKDEDGKKKVIRPKAFSERRHEMFRTSLDHMLSDQLEDIRESEEEDFGNSSVSEDELGGRKRENRKTEADQNFSDSDGLDSMDSDPPPPRVPSPTKLSLDRQFTKSALISWQGASLPNEEIQGYNIYIDGRLKTQVKGSKKTNALLEDIDPNETYRLSVRTKSVNGKESPDYAATMVCGTDAKLLPYNLQILHVTQTSAEVDWVPANSCYGHEVFLDDSLLQCVKPAVSSYTLCDLSPSTLYRARVRTVVPNHIKVALGKAGTEENFSSDIEFTTCAGGLPEPPVDLRLEQQTAEKIILTWLPVTISPTGYSNGFKVSGYKVYVNGVYCTETDSASLDSVNISTERLRNLGKRHDFTRMRFVVRTQSILGESTDSNVVEVSNEGGGSVTESQLSVEQQDSNETEVRTTSDSSAVAEASCATENDIHKQIEGSSQQISDNVLSDLERKTGTSDGLPNSIDLETRPDESHSLVDLSPSVATGNTGDDDDNNRTNEQKREDFMTATHDLRSDDDRGKPVEPYSAEYAVGQHKEAHSAEESETSSTTDNIEEHSETKEHYMGSGDTASAFADELPSAGRRKPNVIHYDIDDDTETESCTAESKTETEEVKEHYMGSGDTASAFADELPSAGRRKPNVIHYDVDDDTETESCTAESKTETEEVKEHYMGSGDTASAFADELPSAGRRKPNVIHYDVDDDTETESCTAESKTETEEVKEHYMGSGNTASAFADELPSAGRRKPNVKHYDVDDDTETESCTAESKTETEEVEEHYMGSGDTASAFADELPSDGRRKPSVIHYDVDDDTESESYTAESKTETEEESVEIFVDPKIATNENKDGSEVEQVKDSTAIPKEDQGLPNMTVSDRQQSESETDTDYEELLSVIDEVDEENLTETSNNSLTENPDEDISSNEDPTISSGKLNSVVSNSSKISARSGSKTRTLSSEDEGFRTDDDVLDLLDDDNDVARDKPWEGEGSTGREEPWEGEGSTGREEPWEGEGSTGREEPWEGEGSTGREEPWEGEGSTGREEPWEGEGSTGREEPWEGEGSTGREEPWEGEGSTGREEPWEGERSTGREEPWEGEGSTGREEPWEGERSTVREEPWEGEGSTGREEDTHNIVPAMINGEHTDNAVLNNTSAETTEVGDSANNRTQTKLNDENQEMDSSDTLSDKVETNGNATGDDSNGDTSDSSYPTRTSLNSDSSLSSSDHDAPPPPDRALDTIIKTLSLPGNRELGSGESDPNNDNAYLGSDSEKASLLLSESGRSEPEGGDNLTELVRFFVALYNYDPLSMSPNADGADEELPFTEGDLIKVFGDKDDDGFFWGECKTRQGFVPSNMISEVSIDEAEDLFEETSNNLPSFEAINKFPHKQINGHSELDVDVDSEDTDVKDRLSFWEHLGNGELEPRKMRALFDYDPVRDSPNVDSEVELMFKTGEIIYVFGDIDDDGFFQGELRGIRGLVPSNFLELVKDDTYDSKENINVSQLLISPTKGSASTSQEQEAMILSPDLPNGALREQEEQQLLQKKKKGIFSKGKRIFKKAFR